MAEKIDNTLTFKVPDAFRDEMARRVLAAGCDRAKFIRACIVNASGFIVEHPEFIESMQDFGERSQ